MNKKLLVDTSTLLMGVNSGLLHTISSEHSEMKACTVIAVKDEIKKICSEGNGRKQEAAKLALSLISDETLYIVPEFAQYADDALLEAAKKLPAALATQDRQLQTRARQAGVETYAATRAGRLRKIN